MWVTGSHTLTHLFHELVIVLAAVDLPGSVERHGSRLVGLKAAGDEALADRGIVNAHWPPFIYSPPLVSQSPFPPHPLTPHPSLNWHGRCSSLSHWLSVCWCGHLKTVSNVGRLPHDLEHKLINNRRATPFSESGTVKHCGTVLQRREKEEWAVRMVAHGSHSTEPLSVPQSFLCRPVCAWHENEFLSASNNLSWHAYNK